ncbi:MAG: hypothetical protein V7K57_20050 [Nostoc sp.]|uniref:hypothetical protein n=1 Tax=Nostoc sp. TaxID=1180 RepID=UPI002FFC4A00
MNLLWGGHLARPSCANKMRDSLTCFLVVINIPWGILKARLFVVWIASTLLTLGDVRDVFEPYLAIFLAAALESS